MKIRDEIMAMVGEMKFASAPVAETSNLYKDLGYDSLQFVRLLTRIEETRAISIDIMEMGICLNVKGLIDLVQKKVKEVAHDSAFVDPSEESRQNCPH